MRRITIPLIVVLTIFLCVSPFIGSAKIIRLTPKYSGDFSLVQSQETDTITLTTGDSNNIQLKFIALNPADVPLPISSVVNFNTRIEETDNGYKWSYDLNLPNSDFTAKVHVSSYNPITVLEDKYVVVDDSLISFDDVLDYDYSFVLTQIDNYNAEYVITKDYASHGINPGDLIIIDPLITAYPNNDGYLEQLQSTQAITIFSTGAELQAGIDEAGDDLIKRTYLRFDTSNIGIYDTIINATLSIRLKGKTVATTCFAILDSIPNYEDLGALDWNAVNTTINYTWFDETAPNNYYYQDVMDYIVKDGITAFRIRGSLETYDVGDCFFKFDSNESVNSPILEIYYEEGVPPSPTTVPNFNISDPNSLLVYEQASCGFLAPSTQPYDPKIACEPNGISCVAILYENQPICGQGIKVLLTYDGFNSVSTLGTLPIAFSQIIYLNEYYNRGQELPYDIVFDTFTSMYYIAYSSKIWVIPTFNPGPGYSPYTVIDSYNVGTKVIGADLSLDCCIETDYKPGQGYTCGGTHQKVHAVKFDSDNATRLFGVFLGRPRDTSPSDWDGYYSYFTYDVTNTTTTANGNLYDCVELYSTPSCSGAGTLQYDYMSIFAEYSGSAWRYNIEVQVDYCDGNTNNVHDFDNLASPIDDFNHVFFGGNLYYRNNTVYQILAVETSDLVTYGTPDTRYNENSIIYESINQSDATSGGRNNYYIFSRYSTSSNNGVYVQSQTTYPISVDSNKDISASLNCPSANYTTTGSGYIFELFTPCLTGNLITLISDYQPEVEILNINIGSCSDVDLIVHYPDSPYDFEVNVKDGLTNDNIDGATVILAGDSGTTDINGKVDFEIAPIDNAEFQDTITGGCRHDLSTEGTALDFSGVVEKSGYTTTTYSISPATKSPGSIITWDFETSDLVNIYPEGVVIEVKVYTLDGEEIETDSYNVSVTGNNDLTYTFRNNQISQRNYNNQVPAQFLLYDNRTTYNVTINLNYIVGTDSITETVTTNEPPYIINFYLPFTILDLPCSDIGDCVNDFCSDTGYFHRLSGCIDNVCSYQSSDCFTPDLCDSNFGCYDLSTEIDCSSDQDCLDNENVTYCIDLTSMYSGKCGEDGFCKQIDTRCSTFCNTTIGYCNEKANCKIAQEIDVGYEYGDGLGNKAHAFCNFDNAGQDICVQFGEIPKTQVSDPRQIYFTHDSMVVTDLGDTWGVNDVLISCSDSCDLTVKPCSSGKCSSKTNSCLEQATPNDVYRNLIVAGWLWLNALIPLELRALAWLIFTITSMILYSHYKPKTMGGDNKDTIIVGLIMLFAGLGIGWIHWIFMLLIGAIVSLVLYRTMVA